MKSQYNKAYAGTVSSGGLSFAAVMLVISLVAKQYGIEIAAQEMVIISAFIGVAIGAINGALVWYVKNYAPEGLIDEIEKQTGLEIDGGE